MQPIVRQLIHTPLLMDGAGRRFAPGAILLEPGRVVRAGGPAEIGEVPGLAPLLLNDRLLIPGLVNAHAHLDLTHLGPQPFNGSFPAWVGMIRAGRAKDDDGVFASVRRGIALSRAGGTAIVGDIAGLGSLAPIRAMRRFGMRGVSFFEVFGLAKGIALAEMRMREAIENCPLDEAGVRLGLQPHAPYSCNSAVYRIATELAAKHDLPLATHLAETLEEIRFVRTADGPIADMLREIGVWDDSIQPIGDHPIDALEPILSHAPFVAVHLNYVDDAHIEALSHWPTSVAYCPRASSYFGHPVNHHGGPRRATETETTDVVAAKSSSRAVDRIDRPSTPSPVSRPSWLSVALRGEPSPHRYRDMIEAGINVALGTDSIVCLDTPGRISVLDEMRFLYRRDGTESEVLLRMGTVAGAKALSFDPDLVTFREGPIAGVLALPFGPDDDVDPLVSALLRDDPPEWVLRP